MRLPWCPVVECVVEVPNHNSQIPGHGGLTHSANQAQS